MIGSEILSSFLLALSLLYLVQSRALPSKAQSSESCIYDASAPVIAWPGDACHLELAGSELTLAESEQGLSCPAIQQNSKCFPIWQAGDDTSDVDLEPRYVTPYKNKPIRQAPEQQTLAAGARSISLRWPDEMQHAVFYTDKACHDVRVGRPEFTWHVERFATQIAQCESPPAGLFKSVEFMNQGEYEAFSRKMRGQDREVTGNSQTLIPFRDDDAASTSSAVPLQDQTLAGGEAPPAYSDDPDLAQDHSDVEATEVPTRGETIFLEPKIHEDSKGSTATYISKALSSDPRICQDVIELQAQRSPRPMIRMIGSHVETRQRDKKEERQRITDFDVKAPLGGLLEPAWARSKVVENAEKTYRGGIFKQVDLRVKAHAEAASTAPTLKEWCHRFCASSASAKS
ncbi:MAG: hypothetical protein Q9225_001875 [Loekoesia sp. 1 TL-2023]